MQAKDPGFDRYAYADIARMPGSVLLVNSELKMRIEHPDCFMLAYVVVESDLFYCNRCGIRGRLSDLWPAERVVQDKPAAAHEQLTMQ
jgi:hypothetical protein